MTGLLFCTLTLLPAGLAFPPNLAKAETEFSGDIRVDKLKAIVYRLASPEFEGRKGPGAARAGRYIVDIFQKLKLEPAFGNSYYQPVKNFLRETGPESGVNFLGRNVGAVLPGSDPKLKDKWILLSAHFDHFGIKNGKLYPGADDNASGVAMLLEVAERLALSKQKPRRTIVFIAFDLEEVGLIGSSYFALHPPRDLKNLKAFITADMLGRSMGNVMDEYVFVLGSESSPRLLQLVKTTPVAKGLKVGRLGADIVGTRSDYGPFRDRKVPFLFFTTGQNPDYHRPSDLPDRIDYHRLQKISQYIADLVTRLANEDEAPVWTDNSPPDMDEVATIRVLMQRILQNPKAFPINERQRQVVQNIERRLGDIQGRGRITPGERTWLIWSARILLVTMF